MRLSAFACLVLMAVAAAAQSADVLGAHDMSAGTSPVRGAMANACLYCHAPHSGSGKGPLWGQALSSQTYTLYTSETAQNTAVQPMLGTGSTLCLSCHDGTVAPGQMVPYGSYTMTGIMTSVLGIHLESSHPFSLALPLKDAAHLVPSLVATGTAADPTNSVKLVDGNIECGTCHDPHNQKIDPQSPEFLVRVNVGGGLCLSCHGVGPRTVNSRDNPLEQWTNSAHATSSAQVSPTSGLGGYTTVAEFACQSCHTSHNAAAAGLLRNPASPLPNIDGTSQSCMFCHGASDKLLQPLANVFTEFEKRGHPFPAGTDAHSPIEPVVLNNNRHASCVDCHNAHASQQVTSFQPAPDIRPSQRGAAGVAADGSTLTAPATRQYESCLRCHGNSTGKQALSLYGYLPTRAVFAGDPLNLIPQFGDSAISTHPVMRDATNQQQYSLRPAMMDILGTTPTRVMGVRIFCTDCHNSDNNREFGGTAPNGPHGSVNDHILERRYDASRVNAGAWPNGGPGTQVVNLAPNPPLGPDTNGPYSLCAKCHDLSVVTADTSFTEHSRHINFGFSCSVCHTAHGVPAGSAGISGQRLVNFDVNVVAPNGGVLSYSGGTCTLTCHMMDHNPNGQVTPHTAVTP